jgi:hypothetical protein
MTTHTEDTHTTASPVDTSTTREGLVLFAGIMLIVGGVYHALSGVSAILKDTVYVATPNYTYSFDLTAWGWTHLILGVIVIGVGVAVTRRMAWGMVAGIAVAVLSLIANFLFLPHYPLWSIVMIAIDVAIIYALATRLHNG